LTIAGSDSGGGAGIQADLGVFRKLGVYGTSALTSVTAQNTVEIREHYALPAGLVSAQIEAIRVDLPPAAFKTGVLANHSIVKAVADAIPTLGSIPYVLDPVLVASSGRLLLDADAHASMRTLLLPHATLVTPNLAEAATLLGDGPLPQESAGEAAKALVELGARAALITGGHGSGDEITDTLWDGEHETVWRHRRVETSGTHGTGCVLSAAITAGLALQIPLLSAIANAIEFVLMGLEHSPGLGSGRGPLG
jgi:hydroxymethylpyrimidine/phosphomethylpyrimidine kinase